MKNTAHKHEWFCSCLVPIPDDVNGAPRSVEGVGVKGKFWQAGQMLRIGFMGGTVAQQNKIKAAYAEWALYANLVFAYPASGPFEIRVAFNSGGGAWSYIGKDALLVAQNYPTMNIGFDQPGVHAHETGHSLGLAHEQSFPAPGGYCFNWANIIADLKRTQGWDEATIHFNMDPYQASQVVTTNTADPISIMEYPLPGSWLCNGVGIPGGTKLSDQDKAFIALLYPGVVVPPNPTTVTLTAQQAAELKQAALNAQTAANAAKAAVDANRAKIQAILGQ